MDNLKKKTPVLATSNSEAFKGLLDAGKKSESANLKAYLHSLYVRKGIDNEIPPEYDTFYDKNSKLVIDYKIE